MSESPETTPLSAAIEAVRDYLSDNAAFIEDSIATANDSDDEAERFAEVIVAKVDAARATVPAGPECPHEWEPMTGVACFRCEAVQYVRAARPVPAAEPDPEFHVHVAGDRHSHGFDGPHSHGGVSALDPLDPEAIDRTPAADMTPEQYRAWLAAGHPAKMPRHAARATDPAGPPEMPRLLTAARAVVDAWTDDESGMEAFDPEHIDRLTEAITDAEAGVSPSTGDDR